MRISDLPQISELPGDGLIAVDSSNTTAIAAKNLVASNAGAHNAIFRGKNLGNTVTAAQWSEISAGTFRDLYIGDYWVIDGITYRIAHFDKFLYKGDSNFTKHHVSIVPDTNLYNHVMNDTSVTTGGYYNSKMKQSGLASALSTVQAAFGSTHVASHRVLLDSATSGNTVTGWAWYDSSIDLMTEEEVYGHPVWRTTSSGGHCDGINYGRLALFALAPEFINKQRGWYWLRTVWSASAFACVGSVGLADYCGASHAGGVRPRFELIG